MWKIALEIAKQRKGGKHMHRQVQTHTRCNWKNITYVRNQMENDLVYAKGRCVSSTI